MFKKDRDDNMWLTRGDNLDLDVKNLKYKDEDGQTQDYEFVSGDKVYFRLKTNTTVLEKEFVVDLENNKAHLSIIPADTLDLAFAQYKYEIEVVTAEDKHYTIKANKNFTVEVELEGHANG